MGLNVGLPADIWSIGVMLAEMLWKDLWFADLSFEQVLVAVTYHHRSLLNEPLVCLQRQIIRNVNHVE